jgi:hypothetical protein
VAAYPQPPTDMVMPHTAQLVVTVSVGVVAGVVLLAAAVTAVRQRTLLYPLVLLSAAIAVPNEAVADVLSAFWHAGIGQYTLYTMFGRPIPLWCLFAYTAYFGAGSLIALHFFRRGVTRRQVWGGMLTVFAVDFFSNCRCCRPVCMSCTGRSRSRSGA